MKVKLSVITVSYNSEEFIKRYVDSVLMNISSNSELIVLDNNSTDQTVKKLESYGSKIKLIKSLTNLGFAKGNNMAAKQAEGEYLFFLNPDTEVKGNVFNGLVKFYEETNDIGIVAPKLIMPDGKVQPSVKNLPTIWGAFREFVMGIKGSYTEFVPRSIQPVKVEVVYGAAILIKTDLFWRVGSFDERYFLYYEDVDLCRKINRLGKDIYYNPLFEISHLVGGVKTNLNRYNMNLESARIYQGIFKNFILQLIFLIPRIKRKFKLS